MNILIKDEDGYEKSCPIDNVEDALESIGIYTYSRLEDVLHNYSSYEIEYALEKCGIDIHSDEVEEIQKDNKHLNELIEQIFYAYVNKKDPSTHLNELFRETIGREI